MYPPELELQVVVNPLTWVPGTKLGSSIRTVRMLTRGAASPASTKLCAHMWWSSGYAKAPLELELTWVRGTELRSSERAESAFQSQRKTLRVYRKPVQKPS